MKALINKLKLFVYDEAGPTATEYAILLSLIAMVVLAAMSSFGVHVSGIYSYIDGTVPLS